MTGVRLLGPDEPRVVRLAGDERDGDLAALAAVVNDRARRDSLAWWHRLVPGLDLSTLSQTTDAATFTMAAARPEVVAVFDAARLLDEVVGRRDLVPPRIKLVKDGEPHDPGRVVETVRPRPAGRTRVCPGALAAALDDGCTAVLDGMEVYSVPLRRLAEHTERVFGCRVNINGYLSARTHHSFGAHWDDTETIILQLLGHKHWEIHPPRALSMERSIHGEETSEQVVWAGDVGSDLALYVPRGWGHSVTGVDEPTFHLTVTIPRPHGDVAAAGGLQLLADQPGGAEPVLVPATGFDATALVAPVIELLDPDGIRDGVHRVVGAQRAAMPTRTTARLSDTRRWLAGDRAGLGVRASHPGGVQWAGSTAGAVALAAGGQLVAVDPRLAPALLEWSDGRLRTETVVSGAAAPPGLVDELVALDWLEVLPEAPGWGVTVVAG